jgi:hypothetical protein
MKIAAVLIVLLSLSILPIRSGAQVMITGITDESSHLTASSRATPATPASPASPNPAAIAPVEIARPAMVSVKPEPHRFIDRTNSLAFMALAGSLTADALSTQRGLAIPRFHEMNPLARPFVQTRTGAAFYTAGSFAFLSGGMYLAHKTNHHKLEKITPFVISGWEAFLATRNYHLVSKVVNSPK